MCRRKPDTVRGPDVIVFSEVRWQQSDVARAFLTVAPELVIEIVSPSNTPEAMATKVEEYLAIGSYVWAVDLEHRSVACWAPAGSSIVKENQ